MDCLNASDIMGAVFVKSSPKTSTASAVSISAREADREAALLRTSRTVETSRLSASDMPE
jgi:hypothetical protein